MMRHRLQLLTLPLLLLFCAIAPTTTPAGKTLRVYHIGNSVTDSIRYDAIKTLAATRGDTYVFGRHMIPGTPLFGLWDNQAKGFTEKPFGASIHALENYPWDVITLQPFDRLLEGDRESEFESCSRFIDVALKKSPDVQIFIYQRWPKREIIGKPKYDGTDKCVPIDYAAKWSRPYTGKWDGTYETHDFFDKLAAKLNAAYEGKLKHPIRLVRVGDVLAKFDDAIKRGDTSAITSIDDLYLDSIHLNDTGKYLVGLTFYATMFDADVTGIGTQGYGILAPSVAETIQRCVMDVVRPATVP